MKNGSMIINREIARRKKISENCLRNNLETFKETGSTQRHAGFGMLKKNYGARKQPYILSSKSQPKVKLSRTYQHILQKL